MLENAEGLVWCGLFQQGEHTERDRMISNGRRDALTQFDPDPLPQVSISNGAGQGHVEAVFITHKRITESLKVLPLLVAEGCAKPPRDFGLIQGCAKGLEGFDHTHGELADRLMITRQGKSDERTHADRLQALEADDRFLRDASVEMGP